MSCESGPRLQTAKALGLQQFRQFAPCPGGFKAGGDAFFNFPPSSLRPHQVPTDVLEERRCQVKLIEQARRYHGLHQQVGASSSAEMGNR